MFEIDLLADPFATSATFYAIMLNIVFIYFIIFQTFLDILHQFHINQP